MPERNFFSRVYTFLNAFVPEVRNESKELFYYGRNNLLPNDLLKHIADSGTAKRCITKLTAYIQADGFENTKASEVQVNNTQTADELLAEVAGYVSYFKGFALHIKRKADGSIAEVECVPFETVRKTLDGHFWVNPSYGQPRFREDKGKKYPAFAGAKITAAELAAQVKQFGHVGEIFYVYQRTADNRHYPVPDYYAGIEDVRSSTELSRLDLESVLNAFMPSAILTMVGHIDDVTKDDHGKTQRDYLDETLQQFTGMKSDSNGLTGRMRLAMFSAATRDEVPVLQTFDAQALVDASNNKRDIIDRAVCRLFGIHPVLLGFDDAQVLGNTQAIANASLELNTIVNPMQRMITDAFTKLFPKLDWTITQFTPITYVDASLLPYLTPDEIRNKLLGMPGLKKKRLPVAQPSGDTVQLFNNKPVTVTPEEMKEVYHDYFAIINMGYEEVLAWSENPCSKKAETATLAVQHTIELLEIPQDEWTDLHYQRAKEFMAFIKEMKNAPDDEDAADCGSKRILMLKNRAYDATV